MLATTRGASPLLAYLTPMERDEATATGLDLLKPEALEVERLRRESRDETAFWAGLLGRILEHCAARRSAPVAIGGRLAAGPLVSACLRLAKEGWTFVDGSDLLLRLRKRKDGPLAAEARRVATGTCAAMRRVATLLAASSLRAGELWLGGEPLRVERLRAGIARELAAHGLEQPEGNIIAAGADAAVPHTRGSSGRVLQAGESLVVDLFPRGRLFADCTRTFCVGPPPARLAAAQRDVRRALELARREARLGVGGWTLQVAVCRHFRAAGHPDPIGRPGTLEGYVHSLGHGVGFELHEYPSFRRGAGPAGRLAPGDLFTLEPGLYYPEPGFGVRLEDLWLSTSAGLENLTPLPYDLDPRTWR